MSEIHKGSSQFVYLDLTGETADSLPTATATVANGNPVTLTVTSATAPAGVTQRYSVVLGLATTQTEGDIKVDWNLSVGGTPIHKQDVFTVISPYLSLSEVKAIWPQKTDAQALELESIVRHVIDVYTGQHFSPATKTLTVRGTGEDSLRLPERLLELQGLNTLTTDLDITDGIITGDGWYLKKGWTTGSTYTPSDNKYFTDTDDIWMHQPSPGQPGYEKPEHGYVIYGPRQYALSTPWMRDYPFTISGVWGYDRVPTDVVLAAKLLVNDYGCNEVLYRDRYLKDITFADSDIGFTSASWGGTGNVRADQLLSPYIVSDWTLL